MFVLILSGIAVLVAAGLVYVYMMRTGEQREVVHLSNKALEQVLEAIWRKRTPPASVEVAADQSVASAPAEDKALAVSVTGASAPAKAVEESAALKAADKPKPAPAAPAPVATAGKELDKPIFVLWHERGAWLVRQKTGEWLTKMNRERKMKRKPSIPFWWEYSLAEEEMRKRNARAAKPAPVESKPIEPKPAPPAPEPKEEAREEEPTTESKPVRREFSAEEQRAIEALALRIKNERLLLDSVGDNKAAGHIVVKRAGATPPFYRHGLDEIGLEAYKRSGIAHATKGVVRPFGRFYFRKEEADQRVVELNDRFSRPAPTPVQPKSVPAPEPRNEATREPATERKPDPRGLEKEVAVDGEARGGKGKRRSGKKGRKSGTAGGRKAGAVEGATPETKPADADADEATRARLAEIAGKGVSMNTPFASLAGRFRDGQAN